LIACTQGKRLPASHSISVGKQQAFTHFPALDFLYVGEIPYWRDSSFVIANDVERAFPIRVSRTMTAVFNGRFSLF
jgi:hypothetical protein